MNSFYITLPSNSSMVYFPENKMSDYTTLLSQPIALNGKYEVALTEMNYSSSFSVPMGSIIIDGSFFDSKYESLVPISVSNKGIVVDISAMNGISDQKFCIQINEKLVRAIEAYDLEIRQVLAYEPSHNLHKQVKINNIQKQDDVKPDLMILRVDDASSYLQQESSEVRTYLVIDSDSSIFKEKYINGIYNSQTGKWEFDNIQKLYEKFNITLIKCEPKIKQPSRQKRSLHSIDDFFRDIEYKKRKECIQLQFSILKKFYNVKSMLSFDIPGLSQLEVFLIFFCTPFEKSIFRGQSIEQIIELQQKSWPTKLVHSDKSIIWNEFHKRFYRLSLNNETPDLSLDKLKNLYTPFEQQMFKNKSPLDIVNAQVDSWTNNHMYLLLKNMSAIEIVEFLTRKSRISRSIDGHDDTHSFPVSVPRFEVNSELSTIKLVGEQLSSVKLVGGISRLLQNQDMSNLIVNKSYNFPNNLDLINYILVYTDFIESQFFGDVMSPILKIVPVKTHEDKQLVTFFDNPHYVPIRTSLLSSINITLRDTQGNKIQFEDPFMFVIVKLHLRKIE